MRMYRSPALILITVLGRNVVLGDFLGCHFSLVGIERVFDAADRLSFVILALFREFFYALGIGGLNIRQALRVA